METKLDGNSKSVVYHKEKIGDRTDKFIWVGYMLGFLVLTIVLALFQPLNNTPFETLQDGTMLFANPPDEHARILIPQYIAEHGTIPTGLEEEVRIPGYGFSYGLYNVFPYIVQGYFMRLVHFFTNSQAVLLYAGRMINVLFGTWMAVIVYWIGNKLFKDRRFKWLFCFAVMYFPEHLFVHSYINTDSCSLLATAMMIYAMICVYQRGFDLRNSLWLSGGIILCALSYYNAYGYILSSIFLSVAYFLQKRNGHWRFYEWKDMLKYGILISVIVLLGIGWWFIRSYIVLDGDLLGLDTRTELAIKYGSDLVNPIHSYQNRNVSIGQMLEETDFFAHAYQSFVASFGSLSIHAGRWMYQWYKLFFGAGILGWLFGWCREDWKSIHWKKIFIHLNLLFCIMMPCYLLVHYAYTMDFQYQGRYLLPALIPIMYYIIRGIEKIFKMKQWKLSKWVVDLGTVAIGLFLIGGTVYMVFVRALPIYLQTGLGL